MLDCFIQGADATSVPIIPLIREGFSAWLEGQSDSRRNWITGNNFKARAHSKCLLPASDGRLEGVLLGVASMDDFWAFGYLPRTLPPGRYHLEVDWPAAQTAQAALAWALGAYRFTRYTSPGFEPAQLALTDSEHSDVIQSQARAIYRVRDLINTGPDDMMPGNLADDLRELADAHSGEYREVVGEDLLEQNYPTIHAVGRASVYPPRLLELRHGDPGLPRVTLVGKGVCFDSGGLDLKNASGMRLMKKDMGGAAHVIGLAQMILETRLPVRLRVLVPAVENAVAGNAFHPGDVIVSRTGKSVEIENTDAEGRLVLCDALADAVDEAPALLIDFATLTGAARVALGTELPAFFSNTEAVAAGLTDCAGVVQDPVWRLPLHEPYREMLKSMTADLMNCTSGPFGGAITAALFLEEFVPPTVEWAHFDVMAWNVRSRPGRSKGGEAMGIRAVFEYLRQRFG